MISYDGKKKTYKKLKLLFISRIYFFFCSFIWYNKTIKYSIFSEKTIWKVLTSFFKFFIFEHEMQRKKKCESKRMIFVFVFFCIWSLFCTQNVKNSCQINVCKWKHYKNIWKKKYYLWFMIMFTHTKCFIISILIHELGITICFVSLRLGPSRKIK